MLRRGSRGKVWEVLLDQRAMARFSQLEEAVEAVDYEIARLGRTAAASARSDAPWRSAPAPPSLIDQYREKPRSLAEALHRLTFERVARSEAASSKASRPQPAKPSGARRVRDDA